MHCLCVHVCVCAHRWVARMCGGGCTHTCVSMPMGVQMGVHICVLIACVCMHVGVYTCMCLCTRVQMVVCMCVYRCACVCVHCMCVHMCVDGCVHVDGCAHMYVFIAFVCAYVCVQMGVHVCVCGHLCVSALSGAHKMEPYCQNNAILTAGISKGIRK